MAEHHGIVYFKHNNPEINEKLKKLFNDNDNDKFLTISESINPEKAKDCVNSLLQVTDREYDLEAESIGENAGFITANFVHGINGDEILGSIVEFLYALLPDIHAQAWGCGDDDPWEYWFKFEDGKLGRADNEPFNNEDDDQHTKDSIYAWWHKDMPDEIKEGYLNESDDDLEDEYIVFTGKMTDGTREEMEELAEESGANILKSVNSKTTLLVVGEKPGASKPKKAESLGVKVITEQEFSELC